MESGITLMVCCPTLSIANNSDSSTHSATPENSVTSAAYLLFYRRRADHPLGGPAFERNPTPEAESDETSRDQSPSGEDKRLGESSQNGSSSAFGKPSVLSGIGASHQRGGGQGEGAAVKEAETEELPEYSELMPLGSVEDMSITHMDSDMEAGGWKSTPYFSTARSIVDANGRIHLNDASDDDGGSDRALNGSIDGDDDMNERLADLDPVFSGDTYDALPEGYNDNSDNEHLEYSRHIDGEDYSDVVAGPYAHEVLRANSDSGDDEPVAEVKLGSDEGLEG
jgi:ubiquitin carboxyl-terminal hydrolase 4/11/15